MRSYHAKMERRNNVAIYLGYLLPNIHTQLIQSKIAKTGMENQLNYAQGLKQFHEDQLLYFYPYIFQNQNAKVIDWTRQTVKTFANPEKIILLKVFLPQEGCTILIATHDIFNAVSVATKIGIMKQGELVQNLPSKSFSAEELQELYLKTI